MEGFPYCPNPLCSIHSGTKDTTNWFRKKGLYSTSTAGTLQRYQCKQCGRTFSSRTFSIDFCAKKKIGYRQLLQQLVTASGIRDMARHFSCHHSTIQNKISRLSHQISAVMALYSKENQLNEDLAADGLESFIRSQFFPTNINILVGKKSQYIYDFNAYYFKRKGRTTEKQKEIKKSLYDKAYFKEKSATHSFSELMDQLVALWAESDKKSLILDTDESRIYQSVINKNSELEKLKDKGLFQHRLTNSKEERNYQNKLFSCNYIDRQIRKDQAEHIRETVQFGREMNNSLERFSLYRFWHNFMKPFRINERKNNKSKHAEQAGFDKNTINQIIQYVFQGFRIRFSDIKELLNPFMERLWMKINPNPLHPGKGIAGFLKT